MANDTWNTPPGLFQWIKDYFEVNFTIDLAADEHNHLCPKYYTEAQNALMQSWKGELAWCNPPYSDVTPWVKKAFEERDEYTSIYMLLPAATDTIVWHDYIFNKKGIKVYFFKGRIRFLENITKKPLNTPRFASALVMFENSNCEFFSSSLIPYT